MIQVSKRNSSIEFLRIFFIYGIVLCHIYAHGSSLNYEWIYSLGSSYETAVHLSLYSLGKIGVTGFIFISGFYGIRMNLRKWIRLLLQCTIYYLILSVIFHNSSLFGLIHPWDTWWFLADYLVLCALAPFVENTFENIDKKIFQISLGFLLLYIYVGHFILASNDHDIILFATVYLFARYLKKYPPLLERLLFCRF